MGLIVTVAAGDVSKLGVDFFSLNSAQVSRQFVNRLHNSGKGVHVWTVNDRGGMTSMIELGVDNIITDEPAMLLKLLKEREALSPAERILLTLRSLLLGQGR